MSHFYVFGFVAVLVVSVVSASDRTSLPVKSFHEGCNKLFGDDNLMILKDAKDVHLTLDQRTGSGFISQDLYTRGFFSASIKLPTDYTAGIVVAFYMSNSELFPKNHDEIDFEFLGNVRGKEWRVQTNVYGDGSTETGREERYNLWFDPSEDYHQYSILWTDSQIIFYVDNIPIRVVKKSESMGGDFPSKPMSLYATIWDGSGWATDGGKYKVNYKYAPFRAEFSDLVLHGCAVDPIQQVLKKCDKTQGSENIPSGVVTRMQRMKMASFRKRLMTYSYCYDRIRYTVAPSECVIVPQEAERLRVFDPVTFGNGHHRQRKHNHKSSSRASSTDMNLFENKEEGRVQIIL